MADIDNFLLPSDVVENSVGFSLDIGGSAIKVVYRAKTDYENGKAKPTTTQDGMGIVRVNVFSNSQMDELLNFLSDHCDVTSHQNGGVVYTTGINSFIVLDKVRQRFGDDIKFESLNEVICFRKAFLYLIKTCPKERLFYPADEDAIKDGMIKVDQLNQIRKIVSTIENLEQNLPTEQTEEELSRADTAEAEMPELPCILANLGSTSVFLLVDQHGIFTIKDSSLLNGKVFTSIANIICGECMKFDGLMELATKGDENNLHVFSKDLNMLGNGVDDIYTTFPDDRPIFRFGKPSQEPPGNFSAGDLMAGWLNIAATDIVKHAQMIALYNKIDRIYITGNFPRQLVSRKAMTTAWVSRKAVLPESKAMQMDFLQNGGSLGSLGAFMSKMKSVE